MPVVSYSYRSEQILRKLSRSPLAQRRLAQAGCRIFIVVINCHPELRYPGFSIFVAQARLAVVSSSLPWPVHFKEVDAQPSAASNHSSRDVGGAHLRERRVDAQHQVLLVLELLPSKLPHMLLAGKEGCWCLRPLLAHLPLPQQLRPECFWIAVGHSSGARLGPTRARDRTSPPSFSA